MPPEESPAQAGAVAVAASGGRDSTALLHATARQAATLGLRVVALHVHHGLMPQADDWLAEVQRQARRLGADFAAEHLEGRPPRGESVESWARRMRYAALVRMALAQGCKLVLLAQHRRDQAETFLIQALRGGGAAGLASMPAAFTRDGVTFARPWLSVPREHIDAYLRRHRLRFVDDASNVDARFARARLRALWPLLRQAFPDAEVTLSRAARRAAEDAALIAEVSRDDVRSVAPEAQPLSVAAWLQLSAARQAAALRAWLHGVMTQPVPETLVHRLLAELPGRHSGRWHAGDDQDLVLRKAKLMGEPAARRRAGGRGTKT